MNMTAWNNLNMKQRSELMKIYLQNGITSLSEMKEHYNGYAAGGHVYQDGGEDGDDLPLIKPYASPYTTSYSNYTSLRDQLNNPNVSDKTVVKHPVTKTQTVSSVYRNKKKAEARQGAISQSDKTAQQIKDIPNNFSQKDWSVGNIPIGRYLNNFNNTVQDFDQTFSSSSLGDFGNPFNYNPIYWTIKGGAKMAANDSSGALDILLSQFHQLPAMFNNAKNMYQTAAKKSMNLGIVPNSYEQAAEAYQNIANRFHKGVGIFEDRTGYTPKEFLKDAFRKKGFNKTVRSAHYYDHLYSPILVYKSDISNLNDYISPINKVVNSGSHAFITPEGKPILRYYDNLIEKPIFDVNEKAIANKVHTDIIYTDNSPSNIWGGTSFDKIYIIHENPTAVGSPSFAIPKDSPEYYIYMKKRVNDLQEFADRYNGALAGSTKLYRENWQIPNDVEFEMTRKNATKFAEDYGHINRKLIGVEGYNITLDRDVLAKDGSVLIKKGSEVDVPFVDSKNTKFVRETNLNVVPQKAIREYTKRAFLGESGDIPYYTENEVVQHIKGSNVTQAKDTLKSQNPKHVSRALGMLFSDDPEVIKTTSKALSEMKKEIPNYVDYYTEGMFNDVKSNEEFLKKIIRAIPESEVNRIANNPEHMKLIVDKWYYENTVTTGRFSNKKGWTIEESAKANSARKDSFGGGRNTTTSTHGGGTDFGDYERVSQIPFSYTRVYKNAMDLYNDYIKTSLNSYDTLVKSTIEQHLQDLGIDLPSISKYNLTEGKWSNAVANEMFDVGYTKEQVRNTIRELSKRFDSPGFFSDRLYNEGKYVGDFGSNLENENMFVFKDQEELGFEKTNHLNNRMLFEPYNHDLDNFYFSLGASKDSNVLSTLSVPYKGKPFKFNKEVRINTDRESLRAAGKRDFEFIDDEVKKLDYYPSEIHENAFNTAKERKKYETADKLDLLQQLIQKSPFVVMGGLTAWGLYNKIKKNGKKKREESNRRWEKK